MLNESVINVLKNGMWDLATCANGEPNVVPVAFKDVTEDIFITKNGKIVAKLTNPHQDRVEVARQGMSPFQKKMSQDIYKKKLRSVISPLTRR